MARHARDILARAVRSLAEQGCEGRLVDEAIAASLGGSHPLRFAREQLHLGEPAVTVA